MKLLITGASGQVGHELCEQARGQGIEVTALDLNELDITNQSQVDELLSRIIPDRVINAAAYTAVDKAESEPDIAYKVNRDGVKNLAQACKRLDIPLLHISTDYVFSGDKPEPYIETDIPDPVSVYGKSKYEGDQCLSETWEKHIILRVSWVFGEHGNNFVKTMIRVGSERDQLSIVDDQYGAPTSAACIASTLLSLAQHEKLGTDELPWGVRHLASEPGVSWYQFAQAIFELLGQQGGYKVPKLLPITSAEYPVAAKRPANSKLNSVTQWPADVGSCCDWKADLQRMIAGVGVQ
ncbi:MAG: dTDP-4-dehydrorhamnose reductase [Proteobacteria bacterium]|nr:dTDP-4-dehydrorhamnose reductase [Pseudomonadota bacterium]